MSCPTCDHTMQKLLEPANLFWCSRCGTILAAGVGSLEGVPWIVPKLVERCREFGKGLDSRQQPAALGEWNRLGIAESINTPDNRLMSRKELDKLDDKMAREFSAHFLGVYEDMDGNTTRVYANGQRILVEIDGDKWAIYTFHESGGAS